MTEVSTPPDGVRERILDAATQCLLESGLDARLHATIAERAGLSRPTLYKYVGDQTAILKAVLDREIDRFFLAAVPMLSTSDDLQNNLVDAIVFVVHYARRHELLQKALREHPELVLPALTTESAPLVNRIHGLFSDQLERAVAGLEVPLDVRTVAEWSYRLAISLVTTPSAVPTQTDEELRAYIGSLLDLAAVLSPSRAPASP